MTAEANIKKEEITSPFIKRRRLLLSYRAMREKQNDRIDPAERLKALLDEGTFEELFKDLLTGDPLKFPGYKEKLEAARSQTGAGDAFICGTGEAGGIRICCGELSRHFMMGSMGSIVGEKIVRLTELADKQRLPLVIFAASGGARMQEGMFSLMQMSRTAAAIQRFKDNGGLFISVMTNPCMGGVSASFASLGDICLAEPGALIGFAGPRVIEQTIRQKLPEGFQSSEFQLEHGFVDKIVPREEMPSVVRELLKIHTTSFSAKEKKVSTLITSNVNPNATYVIPNYSEAVGGISDTHPQGIYNNTRKTTPWNRLCAARDKDRPRNAEFIDHIFDGFIELHGDRLGGEDRAIMGGIAWLSGRPVTVIAHQKRRTASENVSCNFGMPGPEGYRKALRLMKQAEKFGRPVITFIDTPGAYPGKEAEENGISAAIAENLAAMSGLKVPVIAIVTGEGNSGGALALGVADRVWMLENAVYSILSPEGFSTILWKDSSRVKEACEVMRLTADDLLEDGFIDEVIPEPEEGLAAGITGFCESLKNKLSQELLAN